MKKTTISLMLGCLAIGAMADVPPLAGFKYGVAEAPSGKEWEDPQQLGLNKEQPHAWFFSFADEESARQVLPTASSYWQSLDGQWKFHWVGNPSERPVDFYKLSYDVSKWDNITVPSCWNVVGLGKDGSKKYGTPIYCNQPVIFQHKVAVGDWKGGVMRTPPKDWTTYKDRNEVGSYRRDFTVPANWKDREIYINFDGVNSFFYLYINGKYVGFSKNSRNTASFNITPYLNLKGNNTVAVEVYRNSDGSFLEAQDMFRLPGIFRPVSLTAKPQVQVRDLRAIPDLDAEFRNGALTVTANIQNLSKKSIKDYKMVYKLYANKLYSDENAALAQGGTGESQTVELKRGEQADVKAVLYVDNVKTWSAELPYRYTLVGELQDKKGRTVETVSTIVGFRKVEIKDTPASEDEFGLAGRYYYINGRPVKLKGVNRQEINPATGNTITKEQIQQEIMLMKRGNINHVRCSHYSNTPYWYYYCDKYGIYLEDEANLESHEYYYGDASLSHVPEFKNAHVARIMEMARATVNHPSVVIWSLGNEAGPGKNFVAAYEALHAFDASRPVQYERNNSIVDMGSNQYPSVAWVRGAVTGKYNIKYPFHISEYAHSMGNAGGNLQDFWDAIESSNFLCGGAIWDWVDQALWAYDPKTGQKYLGYGGDFGDKPNDGMFCMNGILLPTHEPKPEYYEVKKVFQNVGVKMVDAKKGLIEIFNKNYFRPLDNYEIEWSLWKDGKEIQKSTAMRGPRKVLGPRERQTYGLLYDASALDPNAEYFVKVQFKLAADEPWAKRGYVQMEEQLPLQSVARQPAIATQAKGGALQLAKNAASTTVSGQNFSVVFDNNTGMISNLVYGGKQVLAPGQGPRISALRAPTDNDQPYFRKWFASGLHNLKQRLQPGASVTAYKNTDGSVTVSLPVVAQAPNGADIIGGGTRGGYTIKEKSTPFGADDFKFTAQQVYTIYKDGSIELRSSITSSDPALLLPRLGYELTMNKSYDRYVYYGRGPVNNYADRKSCAFVEQHSSSVADQFVPFPKPQSMGNREGVRWCALTDASGSGLQFVAADSMCASALPFSALEMTQAYHTYQLPTPSATHLHLDCAVTGLGGASCGQGIALEKDQVKGANHEFGFIIRPVAAGTDLTASAKVSSSSARPVSVTRDRSGVVSLSGAQDAQIYYTYGKGKAQLYKNPFDAKAGGTVTAWTKTAPKLKTVQAFEKITSIPTEVIFASSQEPGSGDATHLTDGDKSTIWHTMYSVTVAQYPHWVDFDAGTEKSITGFIYLPRQDGSHNGDIKGWKLQVSSNGKTWSDTVAQGEFKGSGEQKVTLPKPVRARYVRFTALSSQRGDDYASGAEFTLLSE